MMIKRRKKFQLLTWIIEKVEAPSLKLQKYPNPSVLFVNTRDTIFEIYMHDVDCVKKHLDWLLTHKRYKKNTS